MIQEAVCSPFVLHIMLYFPAMKLTDLLLPQYDQEVRNTRRILECIPEEKLGWKPHEKSMTLGHLAGHVAELPSFLSTIVETDDLELATSGLKPFVPASRGELIAQFDKNAAQTRKVLLGASDEHLSKKWTLTYHGKEVFGGPRKELLPTTLGHLIHHRGQLTVYLRLNNVVFPGVYGPSADEMAAFA